MKNLLYNVLNVFYRFQAQLDLCAMQFVLPTISHDSIKQERKNDDSLVSKRKKTVKHLLSSTKRENYVWKCVSFDTIAFFKLMNDLTKLLICDAH